MRRIVFFVCLGAICLAFTGGAAFAQMPDDITTFPNCTYCGMDRGKFDYSRMVITYSDGSEFGSCSLHCAALNLALSLDKSPRAIKVADYNTKKLIDAEKATWVIGGKKPGVMTKVAKWALEKPGDAMAFVKEYEGMVGTFDEAMKSTFADMYTDIHVVRAKRAKLKGMEMEKKP